MKVNFLSVFVLMIIGLSVIMLMQYERLTQQFYDQYKIKGHETFRMVKNLFRMEMTSNQTVEKLETVQPTPGTEWKTVLFWSAWSGRGWHYRFGAHSPEELKEAGCQFWRCNFTSNRSLITIADAVLCEASGFGGLINQMNRRPKGQRWVWATSEAPEAIKPKNITKENAVWNPSFLINWTMTYHFNADIAGPFGYFTARNSIQQPLIPHVMANHNKTMAQYKEGLASGISLSDILGTDWKNTLNKTKLVAWMSGHCPTVSRREQYIKELSNYIQVDKFGRCGTMKCPGNVPIGDDDCWRVKLRSYSFYMSMENKICEDYISEKLYLPMLNFLVPVVWGGSDYDRYLPPGSYIDARKYHPKDLGNLLTDLHNNPEAYSRYHLWRGYWDAHRGGSSFCQLCYRLHTDTQVQHYLNINNWRLQNGKCISAPRDLFNKTTRPEHWKQFLQHHNSTML